jgi:hypothetical protein
VMRSAAADVSLHVREDFFFGGLGIGFQQSSGGHDHSGSAVSALHGFFGKEGFLERMQVAIFLEPFDRGDLFCGDGADEGDAGTARTAFDENGAGAALAFAAAVLAAGQVELIAKNGKKAGLIVGVYRIFCSIDVEFRDFSHGSASVMRT